MGKYSNQLWPNGRALAPPNDWFEWVKDMDDPQKQQPYFTRLKEEGPMFFVALVEVHQGLQPDPQDGVVIITADSDQGKVDIHDRRPVLLNPTG